MFQQLVVISFAVPGSTTTSVKGNSRYDDQIDLFDVHFFRGDCSKFVLRLQNLVHADGQFVVILKMEQLKLAIHTVRNDNFFAA